jgi:hypothetical protein
MQVNSALRPQTLTLHGIYFAYCDCCRCTECFNVTSSNGTEVVIDLRHCEHDLVASNLVCRPYGQAWEQYTTYAGSRIALGI